VFPTRIALPIVVGFIPDKEESYLLNISRGPGF
jgi:hypothetical protein